MSVYKPGKGRFWHYDFVYRGRRYCGSTQATTRTKAERVEEAKRIAAAKGELDRPLVHIPTLGQAATTWWQTKQALKTADELLNRATAAVELIGRHKPVNEVTFADIQAAIQKRRGKLHHTRKTVVANATINRDIIATVRPILALARKSLNGGGAIVQFPEIDWGALSLAEPKPKPKGLTPPEFEALVAALPQRLHDFVRFQARYGTRLGEMFFSLADVDIEGARVTLRERKGGDDHTIPLLPADVAMLAARVGRAKAAKLDTVWFREDKAGALHAISYRKACDAIRKAVTDTGLRERAGFRGSHNLRHTAAMDVLRATGNLGAAKRLLGHANIQSTLVYAHVMEDDLRAALDKASRPVHEPAPTEDDDGEVKPRKAK